ncbi:predicted protein [Nematostella vectensis]|uniref:Uncharacterized protein n=1 Tax=Nematostella vectensis TaxID=45351 RepID=A7SQI7_NEMVE|nr:predicted protein [Nematostella vectensis]|eukprot:XP_001626130.1 predicted protein [Nematostella vectensis]
MTKLTLAVVCLISLAATALSISCKLCWPPTDEDSCKASEEEIDCDPWEGLQYDSCIEQWRSDAEFVGLPWIERNVAEMKNTGTATNLKISTLTPASRLTITAITPWFGAATAGGSVQVRARNAGGEAHVRSNAARRTFVTQRERYHSPPF